MRIVCRLNLLILAINTLGASSVPFTLREGRPIVDGVFVNGAGPYRFLLDTGAQSSQLDRKLAEVAGLRQSFQVELATAAGVRRVGAARDVRIGLGEVAAVGELLFTDLRAVRAWAPDVQGVLGQSFLQRFDYRLDFRASRMAFGGLAREGVRAELEPAAAVPVVFTSLGRMAVDTGTERMILFGRDKVGSMILRTAAGTTEAVAVGDRTLLVEGVELRATGVYGVPRPVGIGWDGLMPATLFRSIFFCNTGGYIVFE